MLCPHNLKPCMDDLCRGSGCMKYPGACVEMIPQCRVCRGPMSDDGEPVTGALICDECIVRSEWDEDDCPIC